MSGAILLVFTLVALVMAVIEWPLIKWLGRVSWKYSLLIALCINVPTVLVWTIALSWISENPDYFAWSMLWGLPIFGGVLAVVVWLAVKTTICVAMLHSWRGLIVAPLTVVWGVGSFAVIVATSLQPTPYDKLEAAYKEDDADFVRARLNEGENGFIVDAANYRAANILGLLLDTGESPNAMDSNGTPLLNLVIKPSQHYAQHTLSIDEVEAAARTLSSAKTMLEHGADPMLLSNVGVSAFEEALTHGSIPLIELFLEKGAKLTAPEPHGKLPLCTAARSKRADRQAVVELLLSKGADISALETQTAMVHSMGGSQEHIFKATPLNAAIRAGNEDLALWLLEKGASPKATHPGQTEPLVDSAQGNRAKIALALLDRGADVNLKTQEGKTLWEITTDRSLRKALEARGLQRTFSPLNLTASGVDTPTWLAQVWSHNRSLGWVRSTILGRVKQQPPYHVTVQLAGEPAPRVIENVESLFLKRKLDTGVLKFENAIGPEDVTGLEKFSIPFEGGVLELWRRAE
ncbi:ankyrin repeat protein [Roseimicrobium gellanilyticum]|uniref:Ankyrin repeat protein n=1 Tax=Roseimicrobium gellanilyticum TaxID=748857 RepID=A0A366HFJ0_9BACT|nr:ankyrin repeat domain-containing protein [Roseimicrobium gellanilyticum]RBP41332.1 ankyrin repeat protein [Roseimicrobium gellanilyticum]